MRNWVKTKMTHNVFLDHDYVVDRYYNIYQVTGGSINEWLIPVIYKYKLTREKVFLGKTSFGLKRLFSKYSPYVTNIHRKKLFLSNTKALHPFLTPIDVHRCYSPIHTVTRLMNRARDRLEKTALKLIEELSSNGIKIENLGITGSLMLEIHNPVISDIDLVVYDCRMVRHIGETRLLVPFSGVHYKKWVKQQSKRLGIPEKIIERLYNPNRRATYNGVDISIIPVSKRPLWKEIPDLSRAKFIGEIEAIIEIVRESCDFSYYPHILRGESKIILKNVREKLETIIVNYESLFSFIHDETSLIKARGQGFLKENTLVLITGGRENPGYIYPFDT